MNCERETAAFDAVDGLAGDADAAHFGQCRSCQQSAERFQVAIKDLTEVTRSREDVHFVAEVMRKARATNASAVPGLFRLGVALATVAALAVSVVYWRAEAISESDFTARGGLLSGSAYKAPLLGVLRHPHGQPNLFEPLAPGVVMQPGDGFSFRIVNETGQQWYASIFAIDAAREVHWFFPAWGEPHQRPTSIRVEARPRIQALAEGVTPENLAAGPLSLCAVFSRAPIQSAWIEQQLSSGGLEGLSSALPEATIEHISLSVTP